MVPTGPNVTVFDFRDVNYELICHCGGHAKIASLLEASGGFENILVLEYIQIQLRCNASMNFQMNQVRS